MLALLLAALAVAPPVEAIAAAAHGRVGFAAEILETPGATLALEPAGHFPMQSVYKLPIALAVLHSGHALDERVTVRPRDLVHNMGSPLREQHPRGVTLTVRELLRYAIVESDGTASDVLLQLAGGPAAVEGFVHGLGVAEIAIATSERTMGEDEMAQYRNWCTPRAALKLLRVALREPLLVELMTQSRPGAARIKGLLPPGTVVAHKTGSSGTTNGLTRATNDIGVITLPDGRHLAVAVFVSDAHAATSACEAVIAKLARAAYDWARSP
jgi:beta-lactamase class A